MIYQYRKNLSAKNVNSSSIAPRKKSPMIFPIKSSQTVFQTYFEIFVQGNVMSSPLIQVKCGISTITFIDIVIK